MCSLTVVEVSFFIYSFYTLLFFFCTQLNCEMQCEMRDEMFVSQKCSLKIEILLRFATSLQRFVKLRNRICVKQMLGMIGTYSFVLCLLRFR